MECGGECVDVSTDQLHCGRCFSACRGGTCIDGGCTCPEGQEPCIENMQLTGLTCTVTKGTDPKNCGACNTFCSDSQVCVSAQCVAR